MNWVHEYVSSSIGRKQIVAKTGLMLCGFLIVHLAGNLLLFKGPEAFNAYAHALTANKLILWTAEVILIAIFGTHIGLALKLHLENRKARGGVDYAVNAQAGEMTIATKTMPISGIWTLVFLILHLIHFKFANHDVHNGLFGVVHAHFQNIGWSLYYIVSMGILAGHVHHGLQSALQTYGLSHPRHSGLIKLVANVYAAIIFFGFSSLPVYLYLLPVTKG